MKSTFHALIIWTTVIGTALAPFPFPIFAQEPASGAPPTPPNAAPSAAEPQVPLRTPAELDTLLAPIALYPDPLLAQILPASTAPSDVVLASRYVAAGKDPNQIDQQPWEESVKALARYPDVLKMMDEKLDWTNELGDAFANQPEDVFASVQRLRAQAAQMGNLQDTPQQTIVKETEIIRIVPADPQVFYVPQYSPTVIYTQPYNPAVPLLAFGAGLAMGIWIHNEVDWHHRGVFYHNDGWHGGGYGGNNISINNSNNINIGNGNSGSVWKPNRPGNGNNNRPGNGSGIGNNRPGNGNGIGNGNGNRPGLGNNGPGGNNRPGLGGGGNNKPGLGNGGGNNKPGLGGGNNKPKPGGNGGGNKPPLGNGGAGGNRRPGLGGGASKDKMDFGNRPSGGGKSNQFSREASKSRPAAAKPAASRPAPKAGGGGRAGGGGGGGGLRGGGGAGR